MRSPSARRSRKSGSVMVLFTLMLPTLMLPLAGLAIDAKAECWKRRKGTWTRAG